MSLSAEQRGVPAKEAHRKKEFRPKGSNKNWPGWNCINCGAGYPEDIPYIKCQKSAANGNCGTGYLVRYTGYEVKQYG